MKENGFYIQCPDCDGKCVLTVLLYHQFKCNTCKGYGKLFVTDIIKIHKGDAKCTVRVGNYLHKNTVWVDQEKLLFSNPL